MSSTSDTTQIPSEIDVSKPLPGILDPGLPESGLAEPCIALPGLIGSGLPDPGLTGPGLIERKIPESGLVEPFLALPGLTRPGLPDPGLTRPGLPEPKLVELELTVPGLIGPELTGPGLPESGMLDPGLNTLNVNPPKNYKSILQEYYDKIAKTQISYITSIDNQGLFVSEVSITMNSDTKNALVYRGLPSQIKKISEQNAAENALKVVNNNLITSNYTAKRQHSTPIASKINNDNSEGVVSTVICSTCHEVFGSIDDFHFYSKTETDYEFALNRDIMDDYIRGDGGVSGQGEVYIYTHIQVFKYIYTYFIHTTYIIHISIHICIYIYIEISIYIHIYIYTYISVYISIYIYIV
jgi:hypothetical protein